MSCVTLPMTLFYCFHVTAAWQAIRQVFPGRTIKGCVFHWSQAVWRKVQELGLAGSYRQRGGTHAFIGQLLALPFLPASHIEEVFQNLCSRCSGGPLLLLTDYIRRQWVQSSVFPPTSWTAYRHSVRTNNDVEGSLTCF